VVKRDAANLSLLAKCIESSQSHGSNRIRADEFLNVTDLGIGAILCRGTYPEHSLWVNAAKPETRKAVAVEDVAESAENAPCVGDGGLSTQGQRRRSADAQELAVNHAIDSGDGNGDYRRNAPGI